jgi:CheY-like chemotaxis protein
VMHNILLVEDSSDTVLLVQRAFLKANIHHHLAVVGDGDAAIQYLSGSSPYSDRARYPLPDLILLDIKIPNRSGHEVLKWLRQQPDLQRLLVVILSSSKEPADIDRAYTLGANSYLVKPVEFNALSEMMSVLDLYWGKLNQPPTVPGG